MANPGNAISFNGNSLQTTNIVTGDIDHHAGNEVDAQVYKLSHGFGNAIPFIDYPSKIVTLKGSLIGTSLTNLDSVEDTFKSYLTAKNANLDIAYNGSTRRYVGSVSRFAITRPQELASAQFQVEFTCQPFGLDTAATTLASVSSQTGNNLQYSLTFGGTAPFQCPKITVTYSAVGGSPVSGTVNLGNDATGQQISVTRTWTTGDVLLIDTSLSSNTPVTVNNTVVNFSGAFPMFAPGPGTLDYSDSFTSRTFALSATAITRYM